MRSRQLLVSCSGFREKLIISVVVQTVVGYGDTAEGKARGESIQVPKTWRLIQLILGVQGLAEFLL